ncbi:hypothetical protein AAFF_G00257160 [Aldrovandia affinis]|uniref:Uncharacterized protein n=1 Tax=Aldrovandia affinis TaxID=143900 RepID=A0AAD7ST01_9TELE|nr:hypothetical protein AAFF_G00257160 [Aldrovandia affinis]
MSGGLGSTSCLLRSWCKTRLCQTSPAATGRPPQGEVSQHEHAEKHEGCVSRKKVGEFRLGGGGSSPASGN